ncbi:UbiA family prenyltransferase [Candidatus Nitrosotalea okcheonensis]|uniref:Putative UbiA prenyltransferase n=1 Tax=Candidatus Nitrosotalea okcheonensis TaxID=1903276 RepID=A0A2H1FF92_9ARCH|nr:UbiA family prenyltransferase [Candidatus Nitrosotalea okcheonensis]SMH71431.1 putative UbiA prenyltransferase [Candidatus Nitrosotalea okcheonensis]
MFRKYLQLVRLPNAFTAPTNVVAGYFAVTPFSELNYVNLTILMASSMLLYVSGVVFNDYFDIEVDRKERPSRPLPSGAISKQRTAQIAVASMALAIMLAFFVSWSSFVISFFLSCMIFGYDYRLKNNKIFSPITMGGTRFFNVIMGASASLQLSFHPNLSGLVFVAGSVFLYVVVITLFSKKELSGIKSKRHTVIFFSVIYGIIASITIATFLEFIKTDSLVILVPYTIIMSLIIKQALAGDASSIQNVIKNMVISIIILDSIFVSGFAGLSYGLPTLLFLVPAILLSKKFYVT